MASASRPSEHDGDIISLHSIDIADEERDFYRVGSEMTEEELSPGSEEEMAQGLTSHAQRISGTALNLGASSGQGPRSPAPRTPNRKQGAFSGRLHSYYGSPSSRHTKRSPSPLGRKVSSAVHRASARIVNLSNEPDDIAVQTSPVQNSTTPEVEHLPEKDYFHAVQAVTPPDVPPELQGRSLGLFGPKSSIRQFLCTILLNPFTEPVILLLIIFQVVILTVDSSFDFIGHPEILKWGQWTDWALVIVFSLYTIEGFARAIVSGLWYNPPPSTSPQSHQQHLQPTISGSHVSNSRQPGPQSTAARPASRQLWGKLSPPDLLSGSRDRRKALILKRAYLRHSFNRIDVVSIISFWIYFMLGVTHLEYRHHVFIFKALSCMRILRLLNVTNGTSAILKSLKKAAPLLVNVAFFVGFFWVFIAVIGVQSFKGSFRRQCVWVDPQGVQPNQTQYLQFCGGQWVDGNKTNYLLENWQASKGSPKGFICPEESWCVQNENPYGGTVNFDNIFNSMELVFVIMSSNTFTDLMYAEIHHAA